MKNYNSRYFLLFFIIFIFLYFLLFFIIFYIFFFFIFFSSKILWANLKRDCKKKKIYIYIYISSCENESITIGNTYMWLYVVICEERIRGHPCQDKYSTHTLQVLNRWGGWKSKIKFSLYKNHQFSEMAQLKFWYGGGGGGGALGN